MTRDPATRSPSTEVTPRAESVNSTFHEAYDEARADASRESPVLIVLGDDLVLAQGEARTVTSSIPPLFHWTKAAAHAPVAVVAVHHRNPRATLDEPSRAKLTTLLESMNGLLRSLENAGLAAEDESTVHNLRRIVTGTAEYVGASLAGGRLEPPALAKFTATMGPPLLQSTQDATALQLRALHTDVTRIFKSLDADARAGLEVVVAGAHQARARNLPLQYFEKLFGEAPGAEVRVSYAENADSVEAALAQVGTRRLDRAIARAFFGDARRLQRDILGDAAKEQLASFEVEPEP